MLNGNHPVSQVEVGTMAKGAPDQELIPAQGHLVEHGICWFDKSCPGHVDQGSPSSVDTLKQTDPNPVAMPGLQPAAPLLAGIGNCGSLSYLSWLVAWFVR